MQHQCNHVWEWCNDSPDGWYRVPNKDFMEKRSRCRACGAYKLLGIPESQYLEMKELDDFSSIEDPKWRL